MATAEGTATGAVATVAVVVPPARSSGPSGIEINDRNPLVLYVAALVACCGLWLYCDIGIGENKLGTLDDNDNNCYYEFSMFDVQGSCISSLLDDWDYGDWCSLNRKADICTIRDKGVTFFLFYFIGLLNFFTIIIPLSIIVCCTPKSCCGCGDTCCETSCCIEESCCAGLCLRNTTLIALFANFLLFIIAVIVWGSDNPDLMQDYFGCDNCDFEWGLTWVAALVIGLLQLIIGIVLMYKDKCRYK